MTTAAQASGAGLALASLGCDFARQAGPQPVFSAPVDAGQWRAAAALVAGHGGRLVALWGADRRAAGGQHAVTAAYALAGVLYCLDLPLAAAAGTGAGTDARPLEPAEYPDLGSVFPGAVRMQRAIADLNGLRAAHLPGAPADIDRRPWLRHSAWPPDYFPLRQEASGDERFEAQDERYPFVPVDGDGVHEIAVGPVHAGIIEPGHFRFSVVGEKVLRLEERLGYTHKGTEKRFAGMELPAARGWLCGYRATAPWPTDGPTARRPNSLCATTVPERAPVLRALALERERVANHLGDLGALGNDAGFAFGLAQFSRLREDWLRRNGACFGHRLLMDWIVPGGVRTDPAADALRALDADATVLEAEVGRLCAIYDGHAGLQDRFAGTGCVPAALARTLNLTGLAARASGAGSDLRSEPGFAPYDRLAFHAAQATGGDVAARVAVRFAEIAESLRLIRAIVRGAAGRTVRRAAGRAGRARPGSRLDRRVAGRGAGCPGAR